ncbi:hypothetical protein J7384_05215 [Endozoicomonas sp. G2_1]|uniref:hypothetical protein n=1 Tax=Endozoicomonas sp. G2_1 TaxID=2821091 RepID=UPI001ADD2BC9|nr:hypothetical protein [Endozoicomonas sp. G2_1]MBO9489761.1 hypothetical protein [Endozoicomonas sp. G2_1]
MNRLNTITTSLAISFASTALISAHAIADELLAIDAHGISSITATEDKVLFLGETGPSVYVTQFDDLQAAFEQGSEQVYQLTEVTLVGFPEDVDGVSWEAIAVDTSGKHVWLLAEDSVNGRYQLFLAELTKVATGYQLVAESTAKWQGQGRITEPRFSARLRNDGKTKQNYDNWNHGYEALALLDSNRAMVFHETSLIAPASIDKSGTSELVTSFEHSFRWSDVTVIPESNGQCLLGVSFCWHGDAAELCHSSKTQSAFHVFGISVDGKKVTLDGISSNLLANLPTTKFNAEGIFAKAGYVFIANDNSAPKDAISYLYRTDIKSLNLAQWDSEAWYEQCTVNAN